MVGLEDIMDQIKSLFGNETEKEEEKVDSEIIDESSDENQKNVKNLKKMRILTQKYLMYQIIYIPTMMQTLFVNHIMQN